MGGRFIGRAAAATRTVEPIYICRSTSSPPWRTSTSAARIVLVPQP